MIPVASIPTYIYISILQKMTLVTWMRMRRTCKAVFDFVVQEQHRFSFRGNKIYIKCSTASNLKLLLMRYDCGFSNTEEYNLKNARVDFAGLVFSYIIISPIDGDLYSEDEWKEMSIMLGNFLKEAPLRTKILLLSLELKYAETIAALFPSAETLSIILQEDLMEDDRVPMKDRNRERRYFEDPEEVLSIMDRPTFKHFAKIHMNMDYIDEFIFPLIRRFDWIRTQIDYSEDSTKFFVNQLLTKIENGSYDLGLGKHVRFDYFSKVNDRLVDGKIFNFPELEGIGGTRIWHTYQQRGRIYEVYSSACVLIENPNYSALLTLTNGELPPNPRRCNVDFAIHIRSAFSAEEIVDILIGEFPYLPEKSRVECTAFARDRNWKELGDHVVNKLEKFPVD